MAVRFDQAIINQIQQANDIVEVISEHLNLVKKGREMVGLCPFHEDHRPSLYVNSVKQIFKCFACGAGGSVFTFVQMRENLTFPQAIERLAERAGIKLPAHTPRTKVDSSESIDPNRLAKANEWACKYFKKNLNDKKKGKYARNYIAERKITPESIEKWQIGLAVPDDALLKAAKAQKAPVDLLIKAGLVTGQNHDKFVNRLMFPIADITGRVIGFGGRTLEGADAKYMNSPATVLFDKSNSMYGLEQARRQIAACGVAVVVEGYTDCIMAHQFGCCNVVATLGTSFTAGHGRILRRYAKKVVLIFDSDTAGIEAANRALEVCLSQRIDIKLTSVPEGKDPCDFLLKAGKESFERLVDEAVDVFKFKWERLIESFGGEDTFVDNRAAIEEFLNAIAVSLRAGSLSPIDKGLIVNRLSKIIGIGSKEINVVLGRKLAREQRASSYAVKNQKVVSFDLGEGLSATAQREILEVLLNEPLLFKDVKKKIKPENFDVPILNQTASILFETLRDCPTASLSEILAKAESAQVSSTIVKLAQDGEEKGNFQVRLTGALDAIGRIVRQKKNGGIKKIQDQRKFLKHLHENTVKQNPYNVGMT